MREIRHAVMCRHETNRCLFGDQALDDGSIIPGNRLSLGGGGDTGHLPPGGFLPPLDAHTDVGVLVNIALLWLVLPEKAVGESNISSREDMPLARYYCSYEGVETRVAD